MNNQNKNILNILKSNYISFIILFLVQLISSIIFISIVTIFKTVLDIKPIILSIFILFIVINIISYKIHISSVKYFINATPIECIIEDFIIIEHGNYEDISYTLSPIVKANNQLFFAYDKYCTNNWGQSYIKTLNTFNIAIFRKDKSKVNIGDKAYLYIKKTINVNVDINIEKNTFKLDSYNNYFHNFNNNYDINIMKKVIFFEGIIDVEPME